MDMWQVTRLMLPQTAGPYGNHRPRRPDDWDVPGARPALEGGPGPATQSPGRDRSVMVPGRSSPRRGGARDSGDGSDRQRRDGGGAGGGRRGPSGPGPDPGPGLGPAARRGDPGSGRPDRPGHLG